MPDSHDDYWDKITEGLRLAGLGDDDAGLAELSKAVALRPDHPAAYRNRSDIYRRLGRTAEANDDSEQARRLSPESATAGLRSPSKPLHENPFVENGKSLPVSSASAVLPHRFGSYVELAHWTLKKLPLDNAPLTVCRGCCPRAERYFDRLHLYRLYEQEFDIEWSAARKLYQGLAKERLVQEHDKTWSTDDRFQETASWLGVAEGPEEEYCCTTFTTSWREGSVPSIHEEHSMECPKCGHQNLGPDRFCGVCGSPLEQQETSFVYAGASRRFAADVIDAIVTVGALVVVETFFDLERFFLFFPVIFPWPYCMLTTSIWGRTFGKWAMGIEVVLTTGSAPGIGYVVLRESAGSFVSVLWFLIVAVPDPWDTPRWFSFLLAPFVLGPLAIGVGLAWIAGSSKRQGWHDKIAGTYVIKTRLPAPDR